jgi:hypothetical protein
MLAPAARQSGYTQDKVALAIANFLLISCHGAGIAGRSGLTECTVAGWTRVDVRPIQRTFVFLQGSSLHTLHVIVIEVWSGIL